MLCSFLALLSELIAWALCSRDFTLSKCFAIQLFLDSLSPSTAWHALRADATAAEMGLLLRSSSLLHWLGSTTVVAFPDKHGILSDGVPSIKQVSSPSLTLRLHCWHARAAASYSLSSICTARRPRAISHPPRFEIYHLPPNSSVLPLAASLIQPSAYQFLPFHFASPTYNFSPTSPNHPTPAYNLQLSTHFCSSLTSTSHLSTNSKHLQSLSSHPSPPTVLSPPLTFPSSHSSSSSTRRPACPS